MNFGGETENQCENMESICNVAVSPFFSRPVQKPTVLFFDVMVPLLACYAIWARVMVGIDRIIFDQMVDMICLYLVLAPYPQICRQSAMALFLLL